MHDYITVCPAQYCVHLNSYVIRNLATSMTFDAPPKRPIHFRKTKMHISAISKRQFFILLGEKYKICVIELLLQARNSKRLLAVENELPVAFFRYHNFSS